MSLRLLVPLCCVVREHLALLAGGTAGADWGAGGPASGHGAGTADLSYSSNSLLSG